MSDGAITLDEHLARRARVLDALDGAVGAVFAGDGEPPLTGFWQPDWNFYYLTGLRTEAGAAVLFDPGAEDPRRRCTLFLRPLNPEREQWDGRRDPISAELRARTGFGKVMRSTAFAGALTDAARKAGRAACLHPFAVYDAPVSKDLAILRKVSERVVGLTIEDRTDLLPSLRAVKSEAELAIMGRAIAATAAGYRAVTAMLRPNVSERDIQRALEDGFRAPPHGATGSAYNPIVGAGANGTVLHYSVNSAAAAAGDLVVIDAGAEVEGYAADVTRTYPVSGTFTGEQRELYELVLRAQQGAIDAVKPGATMTEVDAAARAVIDAAGHEDAFMHGTGHQLGLEVHDVTPDGPLKAGMVITIEPGVYFADRRLGIRIEDDVLVTPSGAKNLSSAIPKTVAEIEASLRGG